MKKTLRKAFILLSLLIFAESSSFAQTTKDTSLSRWYIGVNAGVPFGISTFSSFGANKTRAGFNGGVYGGYKFNSIFSAELFGRFGQTSLLSRSSDLNCWLGNDRQHYYSSVIGMEGLEYNSLKSNVLFQHYGVRFNVNVLGFFRATKECRWNLMLTPSIGLVSTKSTIKSIIDNSTFLKGTNLIHFGYGGNLSVGYAITQNLSASIYGGITCLTGEQMDGLPVVQYKSNSIIDAGIRLGWTFGKKKSHKSTSSSNSHMIAPIETVTEEVSETETNNTIIVIDTVKNKITQPIEEKKVEEKQEPVVTVESESKTSIIFPTIYFSFNSIWIEPEQRDKVKAIAEILKATPDINIIITGYTDKIGSLEVNHNVSLQRAEAVKARLVKLLVDQSRISTQAGGVNTKTSNRVEARNAATIGLRKENK